MKILMDERLPVLSLAPACCADVLRPALVFWVVLKYLMKILMGFGCRSAARGSVLRPEVVFFEMLCPAYWFTLIISTLEYKHTKCVERMCTVHLSHKCSLT